VVGIPSARRPRRRRRIIAVAIAAVTATVTCATDDRNTLPPGQSLEFTAGAFNPVTSVAFAPDGHTLAAGSYDNAVRLWNVTNPAGPTPLGPPVTGSWYPPSDFQVTPGPTDVVYSMAAQARPRAPAERRS
jgi:WD40 repeat protein